ncbi:MAG: CrcB family protein [Propionibacteriales bacterium]|nr:CrcB family protein [Propionibacteriales bacterium]
MIWLAVGLGGAVGAVLRAVADHFGRRGDGFPYGILVANVLASFMLGLVTGAVTDPFWGPLLGLGLCGALGTFSTFAIDVVRAAEDGRGVSALINVVVSLGLGVGAAAAGWHLALALA